jgi:macrolide transport system ATP-binding/permease protein
MPDWKPEIRRRLAGVKLEPAREAAVIEELAQYLEDCYAEMLASGASKAEAHQQTLEELRGSDLLARELLRNERQDKQEPFILGTNRRAKMIADLWQDLRYGARTILKKPGFTLVTVLTLALGIGANTAILGLVNALLWRSLPVRKPDELAWVFTRHASDPYGSNSYADYLEFSEQSQTFSGLIAHAPIPLSLSGDGDPERIWAVATTGNYFGALGVDLALGRPFLPEEIQRFGAQPVIVLSHHLWQKRFGADPAALGRGIILNNQLFTVIGVTPSSFIGTFVGFSPDAWIPLPAVEQVMRGQDRIRGPWGITGRLRAGVTAEQAQAELNAIAQHLSKERSEDEQRLGMTVVPMRDGNPETRGAFRLISRSLLGMVALVLLIASANVTNLLLARATSRRKEMAIRGALGAGRRRLIRQWLTESMLLSLLGGMVGVLVAAWTVHALRALKPPAPVPIDFDVRLDWRVLGLSSVITLIVGSLSGLAPALRATSANVYDTLKDERGAGGRREGRWALRNLLVITQVGASVVLLLTSGLFLRSWLYTQNADPGFDTQRVVYFSLNPQLQQYTNAQSQVFYRRLLTQAKAMPGVAAASLTHRIPLGIGEPHVRVLLEERSEILQAGRFIVTPEFFSTLNIPLLRGRDFSDSDQTGPVPVAIINQALAERGWPGQSAMGGKFRLGNDGPVFEVIGVVGNTQYRPQNEAPPPAFYLPLSQQFLPGLSLVVRTDSKPETLLAPLRQMIQGLDRNLPVITSGTMQTHIRETFWPLQIASTIFGLLSAMALSLAAIGIYGVISYTVSQRIYEIGLRMALGAQRSQILLLVVGYGMKLTVVGAAAGLALSLVVTRLMSRFFFGVSAADPLTFAVIALLLALVSLVACWMPARRATKVDPLVSLRRE